MYLEHIVYSSAFALLVGTVALKLHRTDYSWIIIVFAYAPDMDIALRVGNRIIALLFHTSFPLPFIQIHSQLHTLGALVLVALIISLALSSLGIPLLTGFFYAALAYGAHLFEDALVYHSGYPFLWPLFSGDIGLGVFGTYHRNFFGIADMAVLFVGIVLLLIVIIIRKYA